jgi:hypothetical protein
MYRCAVCDAPALRNCECYTQMESPVCFGGTIVTSDGKRVDHELTDIPMAVPVRHPSEQKLMLQRAAERVVQRPMQQHPRLRLVGEAPKKNISSGEDAIVPDYIIEEVE